MNTMTFTRYAQPEAAQSRGPAWRRVSRLVLAACVLLASQPGGLQPAPARAESPAAPSPAPVGAAVTAASLGRLPRYFVDIDGFVPRINAAGTALLSMTIIGGSETDVIWGIAVDPDGNSYIAGETHSPDLPIVNGFDAVCGGDGLCEYPFTDAFMMKLNPNGAILYSTYLGGSAIGGEAAYGIAVDPQRRAIVVGVTTSDDFPKPNALFPLKKGFEDGFVTKIDPSKSGVASLVWSTYLGGSGNDGIYGVATDFAGDVYVTGYAGAGSTDHPLKNEVQGDKNPGDAAAVVVEVKVTKLLGGLSQSLTATASIKANEPDSKPLNNQDKEQTLIKK